MTPTRRRWSSSNDDDGRSAGAWSCAPCPFSKPTSADLNLARTFRKITFPIIFPGVLSAMLFAFTLSYDEFPRTLFTGGPDVTMPIAIYGTFSVEIHPNLFAFGVLTTLFSFSLLAIYGVLMTASVRRAKSRNFGLQEEIE